MFAYLDDVEDMLHGEDVNTIKEMIDISDVRMKGHISQYDQMNSRMVHLADEAVEAMKSLGQHDQRSKEIAERAVQQNEEYKHQLALIDESKVALQEGINHKLF